MRLVRPLAITNANINIPRTKKNLIEEEEEKNIRID